MDSLLPWFFRRRRHYALLDRQGICRAFRSCRYTPLDRAWVEVHETDLRWLGNALPETARRAVPIPRQQAHRLMA